MSNPAKLGHFLKMYVCLDALKKGLVAWCRPIIGIHGCFLKDFCKKELLAAAGRDGNNHICPIVEMDIKKTSYWFIELLKNDLDVNDRTILTILSDQQKGLVHSVRIYYLWLNIGSMLAIHIPT
ncbi:hypothetical protein LguiA_008078 [Lonicera macranthoides]